MEIDNQAQHILAMIESVSPNDTAKLDEIDARVWAYLTLPIDGLTVSFNGGSVYYRYAAWPKDAYTVLHHSFQHDKYTRIRDALKAIRPEGCEFAAAPVFGSGYVCNLFTSENDGFSSGVLPTEELAELHAIIQAIAYTRAQAGAAE